MLNKSNNHAKVFHVCHTYPSHSPIAYHVCYHMPLPIVHRVHLHIPTNHMPASFSLANHTNSHCCCPTIQMTPLTNIKPFSLAFTAPSTFGSGRLNSFNYKKSHIITWWQLVEQAKERTLSTSVERILAVQKPSGL